MGTKNPKVSAYVPKAIKERLEAFRKERNEIPESKALTIILADYFGMAQLIDQVPEGISVGGVTLARMEVLEQQVQQLLSNKQSASSLPSESLDGLPVGIEGVVERIDEITKRLELIESQLSELKVEESEEESVSTAELAKRLRVASSTVSHRKPKPDFTEWTRSKDPDGIGWIVLKSGRCKPETELPSNSSNKAAIENEQINSKQDEGENKLQLNLLSEPLPEPVNQSKTATDDVVLNANTEEALSGELLDKPLSKPSRELVLTSAGDLNVISSKMLEARFGVGSNTTNVIRNRYSEQKFREWTIAKDPDRIPWRHLGRGKGYAPDGELTSEQEGRLLEWLRQTSS